jgi:23S rRNA (adenine-N6)-dimethyltransferase
MAPSSIRRAHSRARRALSQNFLHDPAAVRTVIEAAAVKPDDLVYEVGAGRGRLTRALVPLCREVVAYWALRAPALTAATLLTQLEYARKRTGDYGRWSRLTVLTWPAYEWSLAGRLPRTAFRPVPRVDSGILRLVRREIPLVQPAALPGYRRFVELGFTGVGGSLSATLTGRYGSRRVSAAFRAARLHPDVPVGHVWPEQWLTLFRLIDRR